MVPTRRAPGARSSEHRNRSSVKTHDSTSATTVPWEDVNPSVEIQSVETHTVVGIGHAY